MGNELLTSCPHFYPISHGSDKVRRKAFLGSMQTSSSWEDSRIHEDRNLWFLREAKRKELCFRCVSVEHVTIPLALKSKGYSRNHRFYISVSNLSLIRALDKVHQDLLFCPNVQSTGHMMLELS